MPIFIKTEKFKEKTLSLSIKKKKDYIKEHKEWVSNLKSNGVKISSGYLIDKSGLPGGGGLLVFEAKCFKDAKLLVEKDPMIINNLVAWELQQWEQVVGNLII